MSYKTKCEQTKINELKNNCGIVKAKKQCKENHKEILKKINNSKSNTFLKTSLHTFFYQNKKLPYILQKQNENITKKLNELNELNNKINPKYKLGRENDNDYQTINMHTIDFFNNEYLAEFISDISRYIINARIKNKEIKEKNKILIDFILNKIITLEVYNFLLLISEKINKTFHMKDTPLFRIDNEHNKIIINYYGMQLFCNELSSIYNTTNSYVIKFVIDFIRYYIDNIFRHRNDPKQFILKEYIDKLKNISDLYPKLPNPISEIFITGLRSNINILISKHLSNKNNGSLIKSNNLNYWTEIPIFFSKILFDLTLNKIISGFIPGLKSLK